MIYIEHLSLSNFRNYCNLELDLPPHLVMLQGDNAQGKTNLLEAIYLLATARSPRAAAERELINWHASQDGLAVARLLARVEKRAESLRLEMALTAAGPGAEARVQKRIRINGVPRRAMDLVGQVNVVLFTSPDIELIGGPPALRRRYLDITGSQADRGYLRALQRYVRVLQQRNHLLRSIAERRAVLSELNDLARPIYHQISSGESLEIGYLPSAAAAEFAARLVQSQLRDIARGMSLVGPHRDDIAFHVDGIDMNIYGSRGQQRTIALALKLAEARFLSSKVGDEPVLLLDDVLSELDAARRRHLLDSVAAYRQVLVTATDLDHFEPGFLSAAALFRVSAGVVAPL